MVTVTSGCGLVRTVVTLCRSASTGLARRPMQAFRVRSRRLALTQGMVGFTRSSIIEGDRLGGVAVLGFAFVPEPRGPEASGDNDRLLLAGDHLLAEPPDRRVPAGSDETIEHTAVLPAQRLSEDRILPVPDGLADRFDDLLRRPDGGWAGFISDVVADLHVEGHVVMLSGGAVRDMVATGDPGVVNDLDMAGTVPAGRFAEVAYRRQSAVRATHLRHRVSTRLVSSLADGGERIIEYKGLHQPGFPFPATGADPGYDAASRDFTVNTLLYDPVRRQLLDPRGTGMTHLLGDRRRLVPMNDRPDPAQAADVVLRAIKFLDRWRGERREVDDSAVRKMIAALPPDCWTAIGKYDRHVLRRSAERLSKDVPAARARAIATELGPAALELIELVRWPGDAA
jgi:poly(A) polymerase